MANRAFLFNASTDTPRWQDPPGVVYYQTVDRSLQVISGTISYIDCLNIGGTTKVLGISAAGVIFWADVLGGDFDGIGCL